MSSTIELPTDLTPLILRGHVVDVLRMLPSDSVQCVVTSPPYWGLRAYGTEPQVWGGESSHVHVWTSTPPRRSRSEADATSSIEIASITGRNYEAQGGEACACGAWRGELGLEPTPEAYVTHLADVFDEVRRVLRPDGTCWLNLGDSYFTDSPVRTSSAGAFSKEWDPTQTASRGGKRRSAAAAGGLKNRDLVGIPWMVAFELRSRGWWLRSPIVWNKKNPMIESVRDRPSSAHEEIFMLAKSGDTLYWTHRDHAGSRTQPKADYRWVDRLMEIEYVEIPNEFSDERAECQGCGGTGSVEAPFGVIDCEACGGSGTIRRWKRINLWSGHAYFYDQDGYRQPLAESTIDYANGKNPSQSARRSLENVARRSGYAPSTLKEVYEGYNGHATKGYAGTGAQDPSAVKNRIIAGARRKIAAAGFANGFCNGCGRPEAQHIASAKSSMTKFGADAEWVGTPIPCNAAGANLRNVWTIATHPFKEAHFATFPPEIPERAIRLGTSEKGACAECGAPWERRVETRETWRPILKGDLGSDPDGIGRVTRGASQLAEYGIKPRSQLGWSPTCSCPPSEPVPCLVLDLFAGSGTTLEVARRLGRRSIGVELKPEYADLATKRCRAGTPDITAWKEPAKVGWTVTK